MADTIRELIIQELEALFKAYSFTSISSPSIYRGRQVFDPDSDPPPLITILPRVEESERSQFMTSENTMPVDIICLERMGDQNPSELGEAVLGELLSCVFGLAEEDGGDWTKTGGMTEDYADDVLYRSGGVDEYPDVLGQAILHVGITIAIKYQTAIGNPYSNS